MAWERVYTVNNFYDGPRLGVADVDGVPHIYEAEFDHNLDEYGDTFLVSPVDQDLLALVLEDWEIWLRWNAAFKRGDASVGSHPALPEDRERHGVLKASIGDRLKIDRERARYMKARFESASRGGSMMVEWRGGGLDSNSTRFPSR